MNTSKSDTKISEQHIRVAAGIGEESEPPESLSVFDRWLQQSKTFCGREYGYRLGKSDCLERRVFGGWT